MAAITIPAGALAAAKSGAPMPSADAPAAKAAPSPAAKSEPKVEPKKEAAPTKPAPKPEPKAAAEPPAADATPAEKKAWKLKVSGKEIDYDASDEERIKRDIQKGLAADETFQSAAQQKKQAEAFFAMLKDPVQLKKLLTDPRVGVDVKKFAEDYVWEQIQEAKMTPEQRAQRDRDAELQAFKDQEARTKADAETTAKQAEIQRHEAHYEKTILSALEIGGIPKTVEAAARMGHYLSLALEQGLDITPSELVEVVRADYLREIGEVFGAADGDQILAFLGEGNAKKLREADLKRFKTSQSKPFPKRSEAKQAADAKGGAPAAAPKKLGGSDWKAEITKDFLNRK